MPEHTGKDWFRTTCCHSALAGLAGRDGSNLARDAGPAEAEAAMAMLQTAVRTGYPDLNAFNTESALDPLRGRPDFRLIMMDLTMPADPFSRR